MLHPQDGFIGSAMDGKYHFGVQNSLSFSGHCFLFNSFFQINYCTVAQLKIHRKDIQLLYFWVIVFLEGKKMSNITYELLPGRNVCPCPSEGHVFPARLLP
jgi:hypothetical protein